MSDTIKVKLTKDWALVLSGSGVINVACEAQGVEILYLPLAQNPTAAAEAKAHKLPNRSQHRCDAAYGLFLRAASGGEASVQFSL